MTVFTLIVFPIERSPDWEWIAGTASPQLSVTGSEPATHKWFSIIPTDEEKARIGETATAEDTELTVDIDTQSPVDVIHSATGLQPLTPSEE